MSGSEVLHEGPASLAALKGVVAALLAATAVLVASADPIRGRLPRPSRGRGDGPAHGPAAGVRDRHPSGPPPDRHTLVRLTAALAAGAATWAFVPGTAGALGAVLAATATWWRSRGWEPAASRRRRRRLEAGLPWLVDLLTTALRAGLGPVEALARVAAVSPEEVRDAVQVPLARLRLGADPVTVWTELAAHPELGRLGVTLRRATESGAPVVQALERLSEDLRAARRAAVEERVRRIEVRAAVPLGACLLPAFVLLAVVPLVAGSVAGLLGT